MDMKSILKLKFERVNCNKLIKTAVDQDKNQLMLLFERLSLLVFAIVTFLAFKVFIFDSLNIPTWCLLANLFGISRYQGALTRRLAAEQKWLQINQHICIDQKTRCWTNMTPNKTTYMHWAEESLLNKNDSKQNDIYNGNICF